ncbi:hypothetical protein KNP414_05442 [Paenibacillus mucilaginosus KNP414]|uniref:Uncharacterized protein n=1 Tax=Paenibacillus mucilaginosus (strain KNP414) TaxID=1036673 RepID=F8FI63_PAEMK|nr:hypothetical protein KNP414_05442 [Paenibacillus mucilaginosus KNP414]
MSDKYEFSDYMKKTFAGSPKKAENSPRSSYIEPSDQAAGLHSGVSLFQPAGGGSGQHSGIQAFSLPLRSECHASGKDAVRFDDARRFGGLLFVVSSQPGQIRL